MDEWRWQPSAARFLLLVWAFFSLKAWAAWSMQPLMSMLSNPQISFVNGTAVIPEYNLAADLSTLPPALITCAVVGAFAGLLVVWVLGDSRRLGFLTVVGGGLAGLLFVGITAAISFVVDRPAAGPASTDLIGALLIVSTPAIIGALVVHLRTRDLEDPFAPRPPVQQAHRADGVS